MGDFLEGAQLLGDWKVGTPCLDSAKGRHITRIVGTTVFG
jgi:hypothetical protein